MIWHRDQTIRHITRKGMIANLKAIAAERVGP
jgi:hypothetical protein